jgi:galactose-1-phosphate uridylyltransferase
MSQQLTRQTLNKILQAEDINRLSFSQLTALFRAEEGLSDFRPDGICQVDPRNGDRIIYNSARARRPHDNRPATSGAAAVERECAVCRGQTTGVVDVADLSEGFTFINKNLFPVLYPVEMSEAGYPTDSGEDEPGPGGTLAHGFHFLQWTSSVHNRDWHNMPQTDRVVVIRRLAALEKNLLAGAAGVMPDNQRWGDQSGRYGFVSIFKNYGRLVGGSLVHGHQQISFSNVMPRRFYDNWRFEHNRGEPFSAYLLRENPAELLIRDYGPVVLLAPYFMRRAYDMMLLVKDVDKRYLHELTAAEIAAVVDGWHDALRAILWLMPELGRETAYNVITNNGPGAGLYFEFLPYSQESGGSEHLGLFVCQENPQNVAARIREFLVQ